MKATGIVWAASLLSALAGCGGGLGGPTEPVHTWWFDSYDGRKLDLLFVIDPTPAIAPVAGNVVRNLPQFATILGDIPDLNGVPGLPNSRFAFVPATVPSTGCDVPPLRNQLCGVTTPDQFVSSEACGTVTNYAGSLQNTFSCLGDFGSTACGALQPLEAMRRALDGSPLLRSDAFLYVVIIAGADDASGTNGALTPVDDYVTFLQGLKDDPYLVGAVVIGPPTTSSDCSNAATLNEAAPRLGAFVNAVGSNGLWERACDADYGPALTVIAQSSGVGIPPPCVQSVRDIDPTTPGLQADCAVDQQLTLLDGTLQHTIFTSCDQRAAPCWTLTPDLGSCGARGAKLSLTPATPPCAQLPTRITVSCTACADPADLACAPVP